MFHRKYLSMIPETSIEPNITTMYHNLTFEGFICMLVVHSVGFGDVLVLTLGSWVCLTSKEKSEIYSKSPKTVQFKLTSS